MATATTTRRMSGREWLLRATTGSSAQVREVVALDGSLRRPLPTPCVVGVVQAAGGAGATTLTAGLGALFAARRRGIILAVDAAAGEAALARATGVADPIELAVGVTVAGGSPRDAIRASLPTGEVGVSVLGAGTAGGYRRPVTHEGWASAVAPVGDHVEIVLTDWGVRREVAEVDAIARTHDVCIVVARADQEAASMCGPLVHALAGRTGVVLALVDVGGTARPPWGTLRMVEDDWAGEMSALGLPVPVVVVPHDPATGRAGVVVLERTRSAVRLAWGRVAAAALELAGGGA